MLKLHKTHRILQAVLALFVALSFATAAAADTIYLKNGRTIQTSQVRVEGDRVFFVQYGGEASLPLSLVDRIEEDQEVEPAALGPAAPPSSSSSDPDAPAPAEGAAEGDEGDASEDVPPEQTREYWQDRLRSIDAERDQVNLQIEDLRRTERAFLFSHRSTADTRQSIEAAQDRLEELDQEESDVRSEARTLAIPPGWLRLDPGGAAAPEGSGSEVGPGGSGGNGSS